MSNLDKANQSLTDLVDSLYNISQDLDGATYENITSTLDVIDKITVIIKRFNDMGVGIVALPPTEPKNTSEKEVIE